MQLFWRVFYIVHACASTHTDKGISGWDPRTPGAVQNALITHKRRQCACFRGILRSCCILPPKFLTLQKNRRLGQLLELPLPSVSLPRIQKQHRAPIQQHICPPQRACCPPELQSLRPAVTHPKTSCSCSLTSILWFLSLNWWHKELNRYLNAHSCARAFLL